jgi:hypothetical protein
MDLHCVALDRIFPRCQFVLSIVAVMTRSHQPLASQGHIRLVMAKWFECERE